jgi:hypothetical protein
MRIKQRAITLCYAAYSGLALTNVLKALLTLMQQRDFRALEVAATCFVGLCLIGFMLLLLPHRWLTELFYPERLVVYWRLKRLERQVLKQVGAPLDQAGFHLALLRSSDLELAIYRTTINILDYGTLLSKDQLGQKLAQVLQQLAARNLPYPILVDQLTRITL